MESLQISLNAVLPLCLYMAAGYLARRRGLIDEEIILKFNRVAFLVFLSTSVFSALYGSDLSTAVNPKLILFVVFGVLAEFLYGFLVANKVADQENQKGVIVQGIFRSNFTLIGLAIARALLPHEDIAPVVFLCAIITPEFNILAVIALSLYGGEKVRPREVVVRIVKNPLIIATAAGILCLVLNVRFPKSIETAITGMAGVATPLMLFLLGAFFRFDSFGSSAKQISTTTAFKLVFNPAIFLTIGYLLGFRGVEFVGLIGVFASSAAVSSFTMSQQMGGDAELAGGVVILTSVFSCLTLFGWCALFKTLGAF